MIETIKNGSAIFSASHWFDVGLPEYLHHCLDGKTEYIYNPVGSFGTTGHEDKIMKDVFRYPCIYIKPVFMALEERFNSSFNKEPGEFLLFITHSICFAARLIDPVERLTSKQLRAADSDVKRAISLVKKTEDIATAGYGLGAGVLHEALQAAEGKGVPRHPEGGISIHRYPALEILNSLNGQLSLSDIMSFWHIVNIQQPLSLLDPDESGKPTSGNLDRRLFCRSLARTFYETWGDPECKAVAIFSSAIYEDTDEGYVRKTFDRYRNSPGVEW